MNYVQTPNFDTVSIPNKGFIIHGTLGSYEGAVEWLCTPPSKRNPVSYSSAHFVISKTGLVTQLADIKTRTWHAGTVNKPDAYAQSILPKTLGVYDNPNNHFIGIELEWFAGDPITEKQYTAIAEVIKMCQLVNPAIMTHSQVTAYKPDFGNDSATIVSNIQSRLIDNKTKSQIKSEIIELINQL